MTSAAFTTSLQSNPNVSVRYWTETSWGTTPVNPTVTEVSRVSFSLALGKTVVSSNRVYADRQRRYAKDTLRKPDGDLQDELSIASHDGLIAAAFCGAWTAGATLTASLVATASASTLARAAGSFITDGFLPGDVVDTAGFTHAANNGSFTVLSVSALDLVVDGALVDETEAGASVAVTGFKLTNGKLKSSFGFEVFYPDISGTQYEVFTGVRVKDCTISMPDSGLATIKYGLMGRDRASSGAPTNATVTPPIQGSLLASVDGRCYVNGAPSGVLKTCEMMIDNGMNDVSVAGLNVRRDILYGMQKVSGSATFVLDSLTALGYFDQGEEIGIELVLTADNGIDFLRFSIPRAHLTGAPRTLQGDSAIEVATQFDGLLDPNTGAVIIAQKSNA